VAATSVGHFKEDSAGNITGSQTRSVGGDSAVEDISGSVTLNRDCTGNGTINAYVEGVLQRTATLALVYDSHQNHARMIFQSLTLPDGINVPVVITVETNRLATRD